MLRSSDPVGAMRLLINLRLADTVFPVAKYIHHQDANSRTKANNILSKGLVLLSVAHEHLADCRLSPPLWCSHKNPINGGDEEKRLVDDEETRRLLWYAAFLKPLWDDDKRQHRRASDSQPCKKANRSVLSKILVDDLKRPARDVECIEKIIKAANDFTQLINVGCDVSATMILLGEIRVTWRHGRVLCSMGSREIDSATEEDPVWVHAMELRQLCAKVLLKIGSQWRAALILAIAEQLATLESESLDYVIEGDLIEESQDEIRQGIIDRFDAFAAALQQLGLIGIWNEHPLLDGDEIKKILPNIPRGPTFREVMDEQGEWMIAHPGAQADALKAHLLNVFADYGPSQPETR